jgi:integrase
MRQAGRTGRPDAAAPQGRAAAGAVRDHVVRDAEVPELGRRERGRGASWVLHMGRGAARRKVTLGSCSALGLAEARRLARALLDTGPPGDAPHPGMPLAAFAPLFLDDCACRWKPATLTANRSALAAHILPELGTRPLDALDRGDVTRWRGGLTLSKGGRNRALSVLSALCVQAEIRGLRPPGSNPCRGLRRHATGFQAAYLDAAGYAALGRALDALAPTAPRAADALRFIALTGCRRGEALALEWAMIDGPRAALPDSKTGPRALWLGRAARRHLAGCPRLGRHVFGDAAGPLPAQRLAGAWQQVRTALGMPRLRIHDLRHSFASVAAGRGHDLTAIGGLLGHADRGVTAGYAHLDTATLRAASARVGRHLERAMQRAPQAPPAREGTPGAAFHAFGLSPLTLPEFCALHGLDPGTFRRGLLRWRAARKARAMAR